MHNDELSRTQTAGSYRGSLELTRDKARVTQCSDFLCTGPERTMRKPIDLECIGMSPKVREKKKIQGLHMFRARRNLQSCQPYMICPSVFWCSHDYRHSLGGGCVQLGLAPHQLEIWSMP